MLRNGKQISLFYIETFMILQFQFARNGMFHYLITERILFDKDDRNDSYVKIWTKTGS